jgi:diketogulonate reductase-like aldo/keto reductase
MDKDDIPEFLYGTAWKQDDTARLVELAVDSGFLAIDTANQPKHYNEPAAGEALAKLAARGIKRANLFIQTKFTPLRGHDHRVPYDPQAPLPEQVRQSFASSLEHLQTDWLDSWLLHGPYGTDGLNTSDWEVWRAMEEIHDSGRVKRIGISNVSVRQISELVEKARVKPAFVQNRCYASRGWDRAAREVCLRQGIVYQGFSLLTANLATLEHPLILALAEKYQATPAQIVFRFSQQIGMLPLTGTSSREHMLSDLDCGKFRLNDEEIAKIETLHTEP